MPLITSPYPGPPVWQRGGHLQTVVPNLFRKVAPLAFRRERFELSDGDFVDLDHSFPQGQRGRILIGHGLEGSAERPYVVGMARYFGERGYTVTALNFRSCSGQLNRLRRMYHHGDYPDLAEVVDHFYTQQPKSLPIAYVGFSMGGNIGLNYAARLPQVATERLAAVVAFSSPLDLGDSIDALKTRIGTMYSRRFWQALGHKLKAKAEVHEVPNLEVLSKIGDWDAFDRAFSLPLHGYAANDEPRAFYDDVSPVAHLENVSVPTLVVQALNDPMLGGRCYETAFAKTNPAITLEHPPEGGHVGFALPRTHITYAEQRTYEFVEQCIP